MAVHLNRAGIASGRLPALVLMTDDDRLPDPIAAARGLPPESLVVVRARNDSRRAKLAEQMQKLAKRRGLRVVVASDAKLVTQYGLSGIHLPENRAHEAVHWRALRPRWLITVSAHSLRSIGRPTLADAVFLAPVFATASHVGREPLSAIRANSIVRHARIPVYALGGINSHRAIRLWGPHYAGLASVSALGFG